MGFVFKVVLVGETGVGKTNLLSRFTKNQFTVNSPATIGVDFSTQVSQLGEANIRAEIWDTAGLERYRSLNSVFYREAVGALVIYDITNQLSYKSVERWLGELYDHAHPRVVVMLVGNKTDLESDRSVTTEEAKQYAERKGLLFVETSALESTNVEVAFNNVLSEIHRRLGSEEAVQGDPRAPVSLRSHTRAEDKKPCCRNI